MYRYLIAAALLCSAAPALAQPQPAQPQPAAPPQQPACLVQRNIYDYHPVPGNRSLVVTDRSRQRFRVNFVIPCYDIQYNLSLRFKTNGVTALSCVARGDQVLFNNPAGPGFCVIRDVEYQTPAMDQRDAAAAAALKQK